MYEKSKISGHAFTLSWNLDDVNTFKSITGYRKLRWDDSLDLDGSPYDIAFTQRFTKYHQISQDLQWLGHTEQLNWVGDLYYFGRSEEHTSELQSLMRSSYAVFCLKKNNKTKQSIKHRQKPPKYATNTNSQ